MKKIKADKDLSNHLKEYKKTCSRLQSTSNATKGKIIFGKTATDKLVKFETSFNNLTYKKIKLIGKIKSIDEKINKLNKKLMRYVG